MDQIVESYLKKFVEKLGINIDLNESKKFEIFSAHNLLNSQIIGDLTRDDLEEISTGQAHGVDSLLFCVNEKPIYNVDDIDINQKLNVDIYFIQSKTVPHFDCSKVTSFLDVVIDFFTSNPTLNIEEFKDHREIYMKLLNEIDRVTLNLFCYYVTLGEKQDDINTVFSVIDNKKNTLDSFKLFNKITIELIDKTTLVTLHKKNIASLSAKIKFANKVSLPVIADVKEAYIGIIPFGEFKKLIMDDEQNKIKGVFDDNIRDFLGLENPINKGIEKTLKDKKFSEFALFNNGITIIADESNVTGEFLFLENYQIVNGCQTSNTLFGLKDIENIDDASIPIKIVITRNTDIRDTIIQTTNSQSIITEEQLFAVTEFQKTLEDYYSSNHHIDKISYERRTNQYMLLNVDRKNIIEIKEQLKSFMAMFFDIPHTVSGHIGKIINKNKEDFFQKDHDPVAYYISGFISSKWEHLQSDNEYREFNKYRYHIFMGFRYLVEDLEFRLEHLKDKRKYSIKIEGRNDRENSFDKLLKYIRDNVLFKQNIDTAITILKKCNHAQRKGTYSQNILNEYKKNLQEHINS